MEQRATPGRRAPAMIFASRFNVMLESNDVEEADELLMAMALHTLADDLAFQHIKRRKQRRDAVTLVVVCDGAGTSLLHRQPRLGAVQRLDLAFLIDRENDGVIGRVDVEADDLFELGHELGIVGQLEPADQMRPQAMSTPDPLHRTDADPSGLRHRRAGPMAGGRRRPCQGQGHNASATSGRSGGMREGRPFQAADAARLPVSPVLIEAFPCRNIRASER
jgi:hypothetical protein